QISGANGYAPRIQVREDLTRCAPGDCEGEHRQAALRRARPKQAQALDAAQPVESVLRELRLVPLERTPILALQVLDRGRKSDRSRDIRCASTEFARCVLELLGGEIDRVRHIRPGLIG